MRLLLFAVSFLLSLLLFAVQPMATKLVLPTLGGTPAVWNTAMFTFQLLLLAGYFYAHVLTRQLPSRWQWGVHALVVMASLALLPLMVVLPASEALLANPIPALVMAFTLQLGLPFVALSATQPLLQAWLSRSSYTLAKTPYVLYSASNLGSFAGLFGYVVLAEPLLALDAQRMAWSVLYGVAMVLLLLAGRLLRPHAWGAMPTAPTVPHWKHVLLWMGLAFLPSSLSLGVTTYITTDIASVPLLWVMGLALYLLSFVDAFRARPVLVGISQRLAPIAGLSAVMLYGFPGIGHQSWVFPCQLLVFFMLALALHGWLAQRRPAAGELTWFYLCLSVGGALGGMFNGLLAPLLFREALEYPLVLLVASVAAMLLQQGGTRGWRLACEVGLLVLLGTMACYGLFSVYTGQLAAHLRYIDNQTLMVSASASGMVSLVVYRRYLSAFYALATVALVLLFTMAHGVQGYATLYKSRNFFGVERVFRKDDQQAIFLMHDTTVHGVQALDPARAQKPLSYYYYLGPMFDALPVLRAHPIAVLGLGIGSLKCYAQPQQQVDFYEINPLVKQLAEDTRFFHQLRDCPGRYDVLLGDGRIQMQQQPDRRYGVIILDAFSSDAIPAHLLTAEALAIYRAKLAPGGVLLVHTTNRHLDLWPLLGAHADAAGMVAFGRRFEPVAGEPLSYTSFWVVMANNLADVTPAVDEHWVRLHAEGDRVWTDQYTNLLPYFKALR